LSSRKPRCGRKTMMRILIMTPVVATLLLASVYLLTPAALLELPEPRGGYLDTHANLIATGAGGSGAFISEELAASATFDRYLRGFGVTRDELAEQGDELLARRMSDLLAGSRHVRAAVLPALDGVIRDGRIDRALTRLYVPNDFAAEMAAKYPHLEFGASVHPDRSDWRQRLTQAKRQGAVLVKWLPGLMDIDPAKPRYAAYYQALVELDLPLLVQLGEGPAFGRGSDKLADPRRLVPALEQGVTVIVAHMGASADDADPSSHERLLSMFREYPNLFADIARLTRLGRLGFLVEFLNRPGAAQRMIYGSDWPFLYFPPVHAFYHWPDIELSSAKAIQRIDNIWDRDVALKATLGVPPAVFRRSGELLPK